MATWNANSVDELLDVVIAALETNSIFRDTRTFEWLEGLEDVAGQVFFKTDLAERAGLAWLLTVQIALKLLSAQKTTIKVIETKNEKPILQAKVGDFEQNP